MTRQFLILVLLIVPVLAFSEDGSKLELNAKAIEGAQFQHDHIDRKQVQGEKKDTVLKIK